MMKSFLMLVGAPLLVAPAAFSQGGQSAGGIPPADLEVQVATRASIQITARRYGISTPKVGQTLKLSWMVQTGSADDMDRLVVTGGNPGSRAWLLIGFGMDYIPIFAGDAVRVRANQVVCLGIFDSHGQASFSFDARLFVPGIDIYVQALEELAIDPYPWAVATSPGLHFRAKWLSDVDPRIPYDGGILRQNRTQLPTRPLDPDTDLLPDVLSQNRPATRI